MLGRMEQVFRPDAISHTSSEWSLTGLGQKKDINFKPYSRFEWVVTYSTLV